MTNVRIIYTKDNPPKKTPYEVSLACSSYSDKEAIAKGSPDLHYYELSWYSKEGNFEIVKKIKRMLFASYEIAVEEQAKAEKRRSGADNVVNTYYNRGMKKIQLLAKRAREQANKRDDDECDLL